VQDSKTFEESLDYMKNIVQTFRDLNESPTIITCFHKFDPDVRKDPSVINNIHYLEGIISSIVEGFESLIFQTSIYEEDSIVRAFSEGVISRSPKSTLIKEQLKDFSKAVNSQVTLVLDENYFLLGSFSAKKMYLKICEAIAPRFFTIIERLGEFAIESSLVCDFRVKEKADGNTVDDQFFVGCQLLPLMKKNFGIFCLTKTREAASSLTRYIPNLADNLEKILVSIETEKKAENDLI
jgi:hypothetical protein